MLQAKESLVKHLGEECEKVIFDRDKCKRIYDYAKDTYDMPKDFTADLISYRVSMEEQSEFVLFVLLDTFGKMHNAKNNELDKYFTMIEVQEYRKAKYLVDKFEFPLIFKMNEITDTQWIGKIDVTMLMKLRQAQLINYNTNAQRTMQKIIKGDKEYYKIALNAKAVHEIAAAFQRNTFIPNPITLNIPLESNAEFYYDKKLSSLVIKSLEHFDLLDGYHRYIAACRISDADNDFNYPMELRIVNFSDDKAKQFIFQEDQKTKMRKIDSNSMDMNKSGNIVATRLNENIRCNIKGLISRNEGLISFPELAGLIQYFYFQNVPKDENENALRIKVTNELVENFNILTESNEKYLEMKYDFSILSAIMYCFSIYREKDKRNMCNTIEYLISKLDTIDKKKFAAKIPRKSLINEFDRITEGVSL